MVEELSVNAINASEAAPLRSLSRVPYSRTRFSRIVAFGSALAAIAVGMVTRSLWDSDWSARPPTMIALPLALLAVILAVGAIFSCFTVEVREETLAWWFGLGAFHHEVRLSAISEAHVATTSWAELGSVSRRRGRGSSTRAYGTSGGGAIALKLYDGSSLKLQAKEPEALLVVLRR